MSDVRIVTVTLQLQGTREEIDATIERINEMPEYAGLEEVGDEPGEQNNP